MKHFVIFIALFCCVITAKAQFGVGGGGPTITGKISGTLIDSVTKQPMDYATVAIYYVNGHAPINGGLTDEKGNFKLNGIHPGTYKLKFTFVGYPTKTIDNVTTTLSKPDKGLGVILVSPGNKTLNAVTVTAAAPLIENKIDKIVYNAEKDLTSAGGTAADVLQKVPLVSMDINGNVAIRGDQNVKVLINGRPSGITSTSLSDALKAIPADQIKNIEVITSPSAKYDAEGSAGIINIVTKSKNVSGVSGSISGGIGTKQNNGNFNLNYNKNRFSFSANISGNLTWPQTTKTDFDQEIRDNDSSSTKFHQESQMRRHAYMGNASMSYDINNYNNVSSNFRFNGGGFKLSGTQDGSLADKLISSANGPYNGNTYSNTTLDGFDWSADFDHKFHKEGEDLDFSAQWSHSIINNDYHYEYTAVNPTQHGNDDGTNNEYTIQLDYTNPLSKKLKLELGGKTIFRRLSSDYENYNLDAGSGDYVYDAINSNDYTYDQDVYAGYGVLTYTLSHGYSILAGVRDEDTHVNGEPNNPAQAEMTTFSTNYNVFIPSLTIQKQINPTNTIKLSYSRRIQRPSLQFLNPYLNTSNVQAISQGNPKLSPEISQTVEANYNTFIKSSVLNFSVYYKQTSDHIEGIAEPYVYTNGDYTLPATLTTYENIGTLHSWGASFFGSINPVKILTIRGSINAYTYSPLPDMFYLQQQTASGTYVQYNAFLSASLAFKSGFIAELFGIDNSPIHSIQGTNPGFAFYALGLRQQFDHKKASLGVNMVNPFAYYEDFNQNLHSPGFSQVRYTQVPFRSVGITFSYSFGKTTFSNPTDKKKGINNDDLKQGGGDTGSMGGGPGGAPGGGR